jgi:hypothetical protein
MNKLSLVGMQLPEKYKEDFDVSSESPSSGVISAVQCSNNPVICSDIFSSMLSKAVISVVQCSDSLEFNAVIINP